MFGGQTAGDVPEHVLAGLDKFPGLAHGIRARPAEGRFSSAERFLELSVAERFLGPDAAPGRGVAIDRHSRFLDNQLAAGESPGAPLWAEAAGRGRARRGLRGRARGLA